MKMYIVGENGDRLLIRLCEKELPNSEITQKSTCQVYDKFDKSLSRIYSMYSFLEKTNWDKTPLKETSIKELKML